MKLTELYKLRHSFVIIGLTGRTGSGCTKIAELLSGSFENLKKGIRDVSEVKNSITARKLEICKEYLEYEDNWKPFEVIKYKDVLLFYLISHIGSDKELLNNILSNLYKENKDEDTTKLVDKISSEIIDCLRGQSILPEIVKFKGKFNKIKDKEQLERLNELFFGNEFKSIAEKISSILEENGYYKRTLLLHWVSCNIRNSGDPLNLENVSNIDFIYTIAELINRIIKSRKAYNDKSNNPTKIIIDSLRNSLEIMFFKERYSAFYMVASKEGQNRNKERILERLPKGLDESEKLKVANNLLDLDAIEYKTGDHSKGKFASPDVYNCIQKSEIHLVNNNKIEDLDFNDFYSIEEQLLKIISLIQQPGIITPSSSERCMQIAFNAKLNSGCISRQVGAVVTDSNYSIKAVGWNDVPQGQTPCNLRNSNDYFTNNLSEGHYSNFERGINLDSIDVDYKYKNKEPKTFPLAIAAYYNGKDTSNKNPNLEGKNCSFCFKSIHNHFEGEKNQVHTKSLHAEENAMLQITKYGGQALKGGILFTTASPCELCSKKAMQLGIEKVYYIDPYPGISEPQILTYNRDFKMNLVTFNGSVGKAYNKLYEPFMAYKDEVKIMLENEPKTYNESSDLEKFISKLTNEELKSTLKTYINSHEIDEQKLLNQLKK